MLTLHLEALTHQELCSLAIKHLGIAAVEQFKPVAPAVPVSTADVSSSVPPAPATLPAPAPHTPRRKRTDPPPAAAAPAAPAQAPADVAPAATLAPVAAAPATPIPTIDEVRYALGEVNGKHGMAACTALLEQFGSQRVSLVPEDKRVAFIAACKAKLA